MPKKRFAFRRQRRRSISRRRSVRRSEWRGKDSKFYSMTPYTGSIANLDAPETFDIGTINLSGAVMFSSSVEAVKVVDRFNEGKLKAYRDLMVVAETTKDKKLKALIQKQLGVHVEKEKSKGLASSSLAIALMSTAAVGLLAVGYKLGWASPIWNATKGMAKTAKEITLKIFSVFSYNVLGMNAENVNRALGHGNLEWNWWNPLSYGNMIKNMSTAKGQTEARTFGFFASGLGGAAAGAYKFGAMAGAVCGPYCAIAGALGGGAAGFGAASFATDVGIQKFGEIQAEAAIGTTATEAAAGTGQEEAVSAKTGYTTTIVAVLGAGLMAKQILNRVLESDEYAQGG